MGGWVGGWVGGGWVVVVVAGWVSWGQPRNLGVAIGAATVAVIVVAVVHRKVRRLARV